MPNKGRATRGMSILDSLIAFVITVIALGTLLATVPLAFVAANQAAVQVQAVAAAQQYLEVTRQNVAANGNGSLPASPLIAIDFGDSMLGSGVAASSAGNFTFGNNGCPLVSGSTVRYDCTVTVRWAQGQANRSFTLETYVAHQ